MRANDAIPGFLLIAVALAMIAATFSFPTLPGQAYGPALFPRILASGFLICGAILIVRGLTERRLGGQWLALQAWVGQPRQAGSFLLVLASILFYIVASEWLGFIATAILVLIATFRQFGVRWMVSLPSAIIGTLVIHWFFATMLRVPLPRGLLDSVL
jgi:putative tricarboxylic transport membrane protein